MHLLGGGHFNPAVSFAVYLAGCDDSFTGKKAALYGVVQVVSGSVCSIFWEWEQVVVACCYLLLANSRHGYPKLF